MSHSNVPQIYLGVIDDVVKKSAETFANVGVHEQVLRDLEARWKAKLFATGCAAFPNAPANPPTAAAVAPSAPQVSSSIFATRPTPTPQLQARVIPQQAAFSPIPVQPPAQTRGPLTLADLLHMNAGDGGAGVISGGNGWMKQTAPIAAALPTASNVAGLVRQQNPIQTTQPNWSLPQFDGVCELEGAEEGIINEQIPRKSLSQLDGHDDDDDDDEDGDLGGGSESGDDDEDPEDEHDDSGPSYMILCQYIKVGRVKNRWKCSFRDGVVHVNGKDYLFHTANGEFEW